MTGAFASAPHRFRVGPSSVPSHERPEEAIELLAERGYDACEIELGRGFWMEWDFAHRLGAPARGADVALSIHAPLAAFLGHTDYRSSATPTTRSASTT
jgi:sugar phosphate isomerase/epimerase